MKRCLCMALTLCCVLTWASCRSLAGKTEEPSTAEAPEAEPVVAPPSQFTPEIVSAKIQMESGAYPNLFAPSTTAVWIDETVTQHLREEYTAGGGTVDPELDATASVVNGNLIVIQCRIESVMADSSIAYDVVRFHTVDCYLQAPNGEPVRPIQTIIGAPVEETNEGTLKRFARTNMLIFPKQDVMRGGPVLSPDAPSVRLVLDGFGCVFYFEWPGPATAGAKPPYEEWITAIRGNFEEVFSKLKDVVHVFD